MNEPKALTQAVQAQRICFFCRQPGACRPYHTGTGFIHASCEQVMADVRREMAARR